VAHAGSGGAVRHPAPGDRSAALRYLCEVAENASFWQHLHPGHIQRLLEIIAPINTLYLDIDGLKDVCLLIAKIVDTYSSFTASHSIMVGKSPASLPMDAAARAHLPANTGCRLSA
jgi:hypothetical protein